VSASIGIGEMHWARGLPVWFKVLPVIAQPQEDAQRITAIVRFPKCIWNSATGNPASSAALPSDSRFATNNAIASSSFASATVMRADSSTSRGISRLKVALRMPG
jgi:hypothetical protein